MRVDSKSLIEFFHISGKLNETGLPDGTVVELYLSPGHPDTWGELYDPYFEYTERQRQQVEVEVYDGLISYLFKDADFNHYPLMNSHMWVTFSIPVTDDVNMFIREEIASEEDFIEKYPEIHKLEKEDEIYLFFEEENGYDLKFYEDFEMTDTNSIEEVQSYFNQSQLYYKELEKSPSKYEGTPVTFTGEVLQIQEYEQEEGSRIDTEMRLAINGNYDEVIFVTFQNSFGMEGIVSEDTVTVSGVMSGSVTYESVSGYEITIPSMEAIIYQ